MKQREDEIKMLNRCWRSLPYIAIAAGRSLCCRPVGNAVTRLGIETEELRTHAFVLEAGVCATIPTTLRVQGEQRAGQGAPQGTILMRSIVQAGGSVAAEKG